MVARAQLRDLGLTSDEIASRIRRSLLHRLHRGVYLFGHRAATWRALEFAAALASGPGAVLSHLSAARFWKLLPYPADLDAFHVTAPGRARRQRAGLRVHGAALTRSDWVVRDGVAVTTPLRTILDIAAHVSRGDLEAAINEALARRLVSLPQLLQAVERNRGRTGVAVLRSIIADEPRMTRSAAERCFLSLLRRSHLALPDANARIAGFEVDFVWRRERLIVEIDGWASHSSRAAFDRDRRRDAELIGRGYAVMRVTWSQLRDQPAAVVARLNRALSPRQRADTG